MITFADVSHHQSISIGEYFKRYDRLAQKVTEGTGYEDPTFAPRYAFARQHGLPFVGYHFDRSEFSGAAQFDWFMSRIRRAGGPRPFPQDLWILDAEDTRTPRRAAQAAKEFTNRAVQQGFAVGGVYSGLWYARPYGLRLDMLPPGWRHGWLSDYNPAHQDFTMPLPPGWGRNQIIARQFSSNAAFSGIPTRCDGNRVLNDWIKEDDMSKQDVIDALAEFLHLPSSGLAVPKGQPDNGNLAAILVGAGQAEFNRDRDEAARTASIVANTDPAKLAEILAPKLATALTPHLPTGGGTPSVDDLTTAITRVLGSVDNAPIKG